MKVIWEPKDIRVGRKYSRPGIGEVWMLGYRHFETGDKRFVSISMRDGLVTESFDAVEMARNLSENGYLPIELCEGQS